MPDNKRETGELMNRGMRRSLDELRLIRKQNRVKMLEMIRAIQADLNGEGCTPEEAIAIYFTEMVQPLLFRQRAEHSGREQTENVFDNLMENWNELQKLG